MENANKPLPPGQAALAAVVFALDLANHVSHFGDGQRGMVQAVDLFRIEPGILAVVHGARDVGGDGIGVVGREVAWIANEVGGVVLHAQAVRAGLGGLEDVHFFILHIGDNAHNPHCLKIRKDFLRSLLKKGLQPIPHGNRFRALALILCDEKVFVR